MVVFAKYFFALFLIFCTRIPASADPIDVHDIRPGFAVTTAFSLNGRDNESYKIIESINQEKISIVYSSDMGRQDYPNPHIVFRKNIKNGAGYYADFSTNIRNQSTALAIPINKFDELKNKSSVEISYFLPGRGIHATLNLVRRDKYTLLVDDVLTDVDSVVAELKGAGVANENQEKVGSFFAEIEILDLPIYPVVLRRAERFSSSSPRFDDLDLTLNVIRLETGRPVKDRFIEGIANIGRYSSYGITFDHDSAEILPRMKTALNGIAEALVDRPDLHAVVEGHTDSTGTADYNRELSVRRARSVIEYLTRSGGVNVARLDAVGYGEEQPKADNDTLLGRAQNRRVDFVKRAN